MSVFTEHVEYELNHSYTALSSNHYNIIKTLLHQHRVMVETLEDIAENFDCDNDAHKYNTTCRKCEAKETLKQVGECKSKQEKCYGCNGRGYTGSENHPECPLCSGTGYLKVSEETQP